MTAEDRQFLRSMHIADDSGDLRVSVMDESDVHYGALVAAVMVRDAALANARTWRHAACFLASCLVALIAAVVWLAR